MEPGSDEDGADSAAGQGKGRGRKWKKKVSWKREEAEEICDGGATPGGTTAGLVAPSVGGGGSSLGDQTLEWGETFTWAVSRHRLCLHAPFRRHAFQLQIKLACAEVYQ